MKVILSHSNADPGGPLLRLRVVQIDVPPLRERTDDISESHDHHVSGTADLFARAIGFVGNSCQPAFRVKRVHDTRGAAESSGTSITIIAIIVLQRKCEAEVLFLMPSLQR